MSEFIDGLTKSLEDDVKWLVRFRRITRLEAWEVVRETARSNLSDSREEPQHDMVTGEPLPVRPPSYEETYWRAALEIADRAAVAERGFVDVGARETYR